jgi:hypothetical protein
LRCFLTPRSSESSTHTALCPRVHGARVGHARVCGGATLVLQEGSPGSKPPRKIANALRSSYQCASIGFRQMVPPLPTSASHPAAFRSRLAAPFADIACLLFGLGTSNSATDYRLLTGFGQGWSAPLFHVTFVVYGIYRTTHDLLGRTKESNRECLISNPAGRDYAYHLADFHQHRSYRSMRPGLCQRYAGRLAYTMRLVLLRL